MARVVANTTIYHSWVQTSYSPDRIYGALPPKMGGYGLRRPGGNLGLRRGGGLCCWGFTVCVFLCKPTLGANHPKVNWHFLFGLDLASQNKNPPRAAWQPPPGVIPFGV